MKIRVMASDGTMEDFGSRVEASVLLENKKKGLPKAKIIDGEIPFCSIHECGHDEGLSCINWEFFRKV